MPYLIKEAASDWREDTIKLNSFCHPLKSPVNPWRLVV